MTQSDNFYSKQTSVCWTCKALLDMRIICHQDEMAETGAWRLGAIVHRLKSEFSWPIQTEYRGPENIAYYSMKPGFDRTALRLPRSAQSLGDGEVA